MPPANGPIRAPDLTELETLVACAVEGSLVAAGARLGISRPAVAKRIGQLEVLAGQPLLHRSGRGVRLTDAGATLLTGARRMLDERDRLVGLLNEMRGGGPSAISGLRDLLGHAPDAARAAQQSEARLAETERVLELVLRASATGVAISNPDTAIFYEVNDAFCRFVGRERSELIGKRATETGTWYDAAERAELVDRLRRTGRVDGLFVRIRRPDGTMRAGETSASLISLAGSTQMLSTIDDVTDARRAGLERDGARIAYRALAAAAAELLAGGDGFESVVRMLPALRECADFTAALLWKAGRPAAVSADGELPPDLADYLAAAHLPSGGQATSLPARDPYITNGGFAVALPAIGCTLILLDAVALPTTAQHLVAEVLDDIAGVIAAVGLADPGSRLANA